MSPDPQPRQTLGYVKSLLASRGVRPKNKLGQNFLIDLNLIDLVVRTAELTRDDLVLEVGTGTGSLTQRLAEIAGAVLTVEVDASVQDMAMESLGQLPNVRFLLADALRNKNELNPGMIDAIGELRQAFGCNRVKLVGNLPYAIATPLIANLLLTDLPIECMVVTVQWEIAERMTAGPGSAAYGALAVLLQSVAEVRVIRRLAPSVFWPRPQVDSAIVAIRPDASKRAAVGDVKRFREFLRDLYVHRRKNLRGAIAGSPRGRRDKEEVDRRLAELGLVGDVRAEQLDITQHLRLCEVFG
ncbi:MAG: 16S rRNA (adenine(1518)-N(6)/adenine(1519)-N(6))-dimethyltransferase RsmA [Gemmataceae bacterium]